jgi:hypothetical protein
MAKIFEELLRDFRERMGRQARAPMESPSKSNEGPPIGINLGIDFGTSFTKVCFRDTGAESSGIVRFDVKSSKEAIIPSIISVGQDGSLYMGHRAPSNATSIRYLKMRLAGVPIDTSLEPPSGIDLADDVTCRALSAWFLANILLEAQSYVMHAEEARLRNRRVMWSANVGVPVEHYDSPVLAIFEKVLGIAWSWSAVGALPKTVPELIQTYRSEEGASDQKTSDFHAIPEIAAAVQSFVISREAVPDFYVYFDIGGGTVDGVAFKYQNSDGERKVHFYSGKVSPIGMSVVEGKCPDILASGSSAPLDNKTRGDLKLQLQQLVGEVIMTAKTKDGRNWQRELIQRQQTTRPSWRPLQESDMSPLVFFLGGYGANSDWYQSGISATYTDFQHKNAGVPPYKLVQVPPARDLDMAGLPKGEFIRFAIAYGLSIPFGEGPDIALPSQFTVTEKPAPKTLSGVVDYLDHKDAYG